MPEQEPMIKKISIGAATPRYIAAKYDVNGDEISSTYAKQTNVVSTDSMTQHLEENYQPLNLETPIEENEISNTSGASTVEGAIQLLKGAINSTRATMNSDFVDKEGIVEAVKTAIQQLGNQVEIKVTQTKRISFQNGITSFSINATENYNKHLKVVIFNSKVSDSNATGVAYLDYDEEKNTPTLALGDDHFANGATFEIYKNVLIATTSQGNTLTLQSTQSNWSTFSLSKQDKDNNIFSVMIYEEGWEEQGGQ